MISTEATAKPEHPKKAMVTELWKPQEHTNTFAFALKTLQIEQATYLASLSLRNLEGTELLNFPAIVPRGFYAEAPKEGDECRGCAAPDSTKPSLHRLHVALLYFSGLWMLKQR